MSDQRVVLVTGASSGVGQSTPRLVSQRGDKVVGTGRNLAGAEPVPIVEVLALDVRVDARRRNGVAVFMGRWEALRQPPIRGITRTVSCGLIAFRSRCGKEHDDDRVPVE